MGVRNFLLIITIQILVVGKVTGQSKWTLPKCLDKCGNITIPYPFGFKEGCYYNHNNDGDYYKITCDEFGHNRSKFSKPMYYGMEVLDIGLLEGQIRISNLASHTCYAKDGTPFENNTSPMIEMGRFTISTTSNVFAAIGCDTYAWFEGERHGRNYHTGCMTVCDSLNDVTNFNCTGLGCCQTTIPDGITMINITAKSFSNHTDVRSFNPCSSAFVVAQDALNFSLVNLTSVPEDNQSLPIVFDWMIGTQNCAMAQANGTCLCRGNSECIDSGISWGYRCQCLPGFSGNPYLKYGCQDIDECHEGLHDCQKQEYCKNLVGSFHCKCPSGFHGNGTKTHHCIETFSTPLKVTISVGGSIIVSTVIIVWLYLKHQIRQATKAREAFFKQNGGQLLHEKLSSRDVSIDMIKVFTSQELEKATNKYSTNNIIGKGGFGIVYKGILPNNRVIAIKKSLKMDPQQSEQFINELIVLSQLNNRHVVKLLGCCLETEVPLLVYEFIDNGTLYDHLHDEAKASLLEWDIRLQIALEVAEVLCYLHTTISIPIIHRDIKTTNILLDKNYTAKVSDFGASRLLPMDQDHLATIVLGTCGYLDPEYLQTSELTQKSDVYSFGVVLAELLTREKALSNDIQENERYLAIYFLRKLKENRLNEILDGKLSRDNGALEQLKEVAILAQRCLSIKGEERPTMKEVSMELQRIRGMTRSHPWLRSTSNEMLQEETTILLGDTTTVCHDISNREGNIMDSCNSQLSSFLASLEYGR